MTLNEAANLIIDYRNEISEEIRNMEIVIDFINVSPEHKELLQKRITSLRTIHDKYN